MLLMLVSWLILSRYYSSVCAWMYVFVLLCLCIWVYVYMSVGTHAGFLAHCVCVHAQMYVDVDMADGFLVKGKWRFGMRGDKLHGQSRLTMQNIFWNSVISFIVANGLTISYLTDHVLPNWLMLGFVTATNASTFWHRNQGWESSSFGQNSGFLMVPGVILKIYLNFGRHFFICICTLYPWVADAVRSSHNHVRHFITIQFVLSGLRYILFENDLVSHAYMRFMEACKRDCGRWK